MNKVAVHICNGISVIKRNIFESVLMRVILEPIMQSEVNQKEKKNCILTQTHTYIYIYTHIYCEMITTVKSS